MESINIGLQLTLYGMGLVFSLLGVMALGIALITRLDRGKTQVTKAPALLYPPGLDADTVAAITIAVMSHRIHLRQQAAPAVREHKPGTLPSRWVGVGRTLQNSNWQPGRRTR
ncbi:MAG: OadG family protein [Chloroflexi bacterium]|nr:OadG family protein [Chloroflexota bacterium]